MKKNQSHSASASALQITICVALLAVSAIVFASTCIASPQAGFYPPLPDGTGTGTVPGITVALPVDVTGVPVGTNFIEPVTTTLIDSTTTSGNNYVGFQGDFVYDSAVINFALSGGNAPPVQRAGLTSDSNWNVSAGILAGPGPTPGTLKTLRISAFSSNFTPL